MEFIRNLNLGQWIVIGLSAVMLVWYFAANAINRRRGVAAYRWLYHSLEEVGKITRSEWFGSSSSGGRILVEKPARPFRRLEAVFLLERREFLPYWIIKHLQGWRDEVNIKVSLRSSPKLDLVIASTKSARQRTSSGDQIIAGFQVLPADQASQSPPEKYQERLLEGITAFLNENRSFVNRITLRSASPHVEIDALLSPMLDASPQKLFTTLQECFQSG
jgi:hypothetical protein